MEHKTLDNVIVENGDNIILKSFQYKIKQIFNKGTFKEDLESNYSIHPFLINTFLKSEGSTPVIEFEIPEDYDGIDEIKLIWKARYNDDMNGEVVLNRINRTLSVNIADIPNYDMGDTVAILYHKDDILLCHIVQ